LRTPAVLTLVAWKVLPMMTAMISAVQFSNMDSSASWSQDFPSHERNACRNHHTVIFFIWELLDRAHMLESRVVV
jgi:hypothetical protein